jgi:ribosomal protein S18 acetylase RimI-like enzyme
MAEGHAVGARRPLAQSTDRSLADRTAVDPYSAAMNRALPRTSAPQLEVRPAEPADVDAIFALEHRVFATDRISRRSLHRFVTSPTAALMVAARHGALAGYALVLFRRGSGTARLYSIAVAPEHSGHGVGVALLAAAEEAAISRDRMFLRLEVHENNAAAITRYKKSGYRLFGRRFDYYEDRGNALRFEKRLTPKLPRLAHPPPYFHQTTEFTCGPACILMALAWADPSLRPSPALEFRLWRDATTIFMSSGPGGCEPYGLAVLLKRHGLDPEVHVSRRGPYFLDTVGSEDKRRVMRLTQQEFYRESVELGITTRLTPLRESALMAAFDSGAVAIVLVSGYHMIRRRVPHWVFAFGREGRCVLMHDPATTSAAPRHSTAGASLAVPWPAFEHMARFGRDELAAAILIRKGPLR